MEPRPGYSELKFAGKHKTTRREKFLAEMEITVPWDELLVEIGLERMLCLYFLQRWYGLADETLEDAVYDNQAIRAFLEVNLASDPVPNANTLLKLRHLLETARSLGNNF